MQFIPMKHLTELKVDSLSPPSTMHLGSIATCHVELAAQPVFFFVVSSWLSSSQGLETYQATSELEFNMKYSDQ